MPRVIVPVREFSSLTLKARNGNIAAMTLKEIGIFIQKTRKAQGLTQLELARLTCVGRRFILELESGKESIHFGKALNVMSALGIGINLEEPMGV